MVKVRIRVMQLVLIFRFRIRIQEINVSLCNVPRSGHVLCVCVCVCESVCSQCGPVPLLHGRGTDLWEQAAVQCFNWENSV